MRRRVAAGAGGVAGARSPVPLPFVSWRAPRLSPPLRHFVGRRDTLPLSSMVSRRPATGAGDSVCGREESRPRGPLTSVDRRQLAAEAGGAARRGPSFLSVTRRQPASGAARQGAGRGARARVGPPWSCGGRRPVTGAGDVVCGREESRPRGPLPSVDRWRRHPKAGGAAPRGPSFLSMTRRQPVAGAVRRGAGRGARARVGQWGRLGIPRAVRGRIDGRDFFQ